jgi:antitoxin PrlF
MKNDPIPGTKMAETLFTRPAGATMDEVIAVTGGPQYNVLRRLEAKGYMVRKVREGRGTRYFAQPPANPSYDLTVSQRGQVVLPKALREKLGITAGGQLNAELRDGKIVLGRKSGSITDLFGILHRPGMRPRTLEEMDEGIARAVAERNQRARRK